MTLTERARKATPSTTMADAPYRHGFTDGYLAAARAELTAFVERVRERFNKDGGVESEDFAGDVLLTIHAELRATLEGEERA